MIGQYIEEGQPTPDKWRQFTAAKVNGESDVDFILSQLKDLILKSQRFEIKNEVNRNELGEAIGNTITIQVIR